MPPTKIERYSNTPFARVLLGFMWKQQPPWTSATLAHILGIHRNRPGNWIYHDRTPELNDAIAVMAQLGIPVQALLDAYAEDGLPIPPLTYDDPHSTMQAPANRADIAKISHDLFTERDAQRRAEQSKREWELMFLHTRRVMSELGMPAATVKAMLAEIQERRLGKPTTAERLHTEEMRGGDEETTAAGSSGGSEEDTGATPKRRHLTPKV